MQQVKDKQAMLYWLVSGIVLILAMVLIGGITRLTGSGLSIVEWNVISGTLPPLSEAAWLAAFEKYKQFPEYQKLNFGMTLEGFKQIFWWEYLHRLLGRIIGVVFILPFLYFLLTRQLNRWLLKRLLFILLLGMGQGVMGWIMVKSGLVDNPHVSHFRLAAHFCLALSLIGVILWTIADLTTTSQQECVPTKLKRLSQLVLVAIVVQIVLGAFVAGLKAGFSYNTYPLMEGEWFPSHQAEYLIFPDFLENGAAVQFIHRWMALAVLLFVTTLTFAARNAASETRKRIRLLLYITLLQVVLGIATLVLAVPITLGILHQLIAAILFMQSVLVVHQLGSGGRAKTPASTTISHSAVAEKALQV